MKNTERFSDRVDDYVKYRPDYPVAAVEHLREVGYVFEGCVVADVGAGTGIWSNRLTECGLNVIAVEPNANMAAALKRDHPAIRCVQAPAEATTLEDGSVDLVTAAQALHWFDPELGRREFRRITRPPHRLAAIWNRRNTTANGFLVEYEALLQRYGIGYTSMMAGRDALERYFNPWFGHDDYHEFVTPNRQTHDFEGLVGRLLSSSYGPKAGHPDHDIVMQRLREIFDAHNTDGEIEILYDTRLFYGEMT